MAHEEVDMLIDGEKESITISSRELPEVSMWKNNQEYQITRTYRGKQVRRTEEADGSVVVELLVDTPETDGGKA